MTDMMPVDAVRANARRFVAYALNIGALQIVPNGRLLKSGRRSPYFFNAGVFSRARHLYALGASFATQCEDVDHGTVVFGLAYKGIPIALTTAIALQQVYRIDVEYAFNRKEVKDHGEGGEIVGANMQGKKVVLADDVMTTGSSFEEAMTIVRLCGGIPIRCVIAFDRQEMGVDTFTSAVQAFVAKYRVPVHAVATLADLIDVITEDGGREFPLAHATLDEILAYRERYGAVI